MGKFYKVLVLFIALTLCAASMQAQKRQRAKRLPVATAESASTANTGEVIGQRIKFTDGSSLNVDSAWRRGEEVWITQGGVTRSLDKTVKSIDPIHASRPTESVKKSERQPAEVAPPVSTWIYLVGGARVKVDQVNETADGAWYTRDKLSIFLASNRIERIARDEPDIAGEPGRTRGWTSGSTTIDGLIRTNGTRFGIDPYLVFLVIEQESHFRPRVVSPKGAQGLMQLMPGTARRFGVKRPFDPVENIRGGTQYLKQLLTMFGGRVDLALASYNAGEGRVIQYGHKVPPFRETQDYVRKISKRYGSPRKKAVTSPVQPQSGE